VTVEDHNVEFGFDLKSINANEVYAEMLNCKWKNSTRGIKKGLICG
jgi:hypothetical protein